VPGSEGGERVFRNFVSMSVAAALVASPVLGAAAHAAPSAPQPAAESVSGQQLGGRGGYVNPLFYVLLAELLLAFALILEEKLDDGNEEPFSP
jgi:hypothetical protein